MKKSIFCIVLMSVVGGIVHIPNNDYAYSTGLSADNANDSSFSEVKLCKDHIAKLAPYYEVIYSTAKKYNVEPSLVYAMIQVESGWRSRAVSHRGAKGLMQLMPETARAMNVTNPLNPEENIEGGVKYIRYLLDRFDGDVSFALAAYNAGPTRIERFGGIPPIKETQRYVDKVLSIYIQNSTRSNAVYM